MSDLACSAPPRGEGPRETEIFTHRQKKSWARRRDRRVDPEHCSHPAQLNTPLGGCLILLLFFFRVQFCNKVTCYCTVYIQGRGNGVIGVDGRLHRGRCAYGDASECQFKLSRESHQNTGSGSCLSLEKAGTGPAAKFWATCPPRGPLLLLLLPGLANDTNKIVLS